MCWMYTTLCLHITIQQFLCHACDKRIIIDMVSDGVGTRDYEYKQDDEAITSSLPIQYSFHGDLL